MAERRMFAKTIIDSDAFIDMPLSTQALYFHLSMRADDEGFINNPKKIMRMIGASQNEMELLFQKRYILAFDSGVVVVKHWKIHNYIQKDRFKPTLYKEEKEQLEVKKTGGYTEIKSDGYTMATECIQDGDTGKVRLGKVSQGKDREEKPKRKRFTPPAIEQVEEYVQEMGYGMSSQRFHDYYESNGWMVGRGKMKDWKAAIRSWESRDYSKPQQPKQESAGEYIEKLKRMQESRS